MIGDKEVSHGSAIGRCNPDGVTREGTREETVRSAKAISLPVRPPTRPRVLERVLAYLARAGPAAELTRERPSEALVESSEALAAVFLAASVAFSEVVDSKRTARRPKVRAERRETRANDMFADRGWRRRLTNWSVSRRGAGRSGSLAVRGRKGPEKGCGDVGGESEAFACAGEWRE